MCICVLYVRCEACVVYGLKQCFVESVIMYPAIIADCDTVAGAGLQ